MELAPTHVGRLKERLVQGLEEVHIASVKKVRPALTLLESLTATIAQLGAMGELTAQEMSSLERLIARVQTIGSQRRAEAELEELHDLMARAEELERKGVAYQATLQRHAEEEGTE